MGNVYNLTSVVNINVQDMASEDPKQYIEEVIKKAADRAIPQCSGKVRKVSLSWWNKTCSEAVAKRKRAKRALKNSNTVDNRIAYKRLKTFCRRTLMQAERESW